MDKRKFVALHDPDQQEQLSKLEVNEAEGRRGNSAPAASEKARKLDYRPLPQGGGWRFFV
jgi:hypothetical protein